MPAVDRQGQRATYPDIIKRFSLVVWRNQVSAIPVAFLNRDLVAKRSHQLVPGRWREAAELDGCSITPDRAHANRFNFPKPQSGTHGNRPISLF